MSPFRACSRQKPEGGPPKATVAPPASFASLRRVTPQRQCLTASDGDGWIGEGGLESCR